MANQITGKILYIYPTQEISTRDGNAIKKRSVVVDLTRFDPYTGERSKFENTPELEFTGDRCRELDQFRVGQVVTVSFDVQGTRYRTREGVERIFTRIRPYKIEARQQPQAAPQQEQQPVQQPATPQAQQPGGWPPLDGAPPMGADNNELPF